ncbi:Histidyl-tRNA synthetase [hydrothermal vent metagenome]|uniref:histidine--tRNA ligase n=1 Tax=hydrothermal vent metagenome TaxID=652676 RepID=A0A3B0VV35_9ZZZZ
MSAKVTSIRGFNDILPADSGLWSHIEGSARRVFATYGFSEVRLPVLEKTELFLRSIGDTTDIIEKQMYTFTDLHGDSLTLRPEGTASLVRAYIEGKLYTEPVARLFYTGPMFRYERPQKGRYRQFYQIGAEVLGEDSPVLDAETIEMLRVLMDALGVQGVEIEVNSLGCSACRPGYKERLLGFLRAKAECLCENCARRIETNPLRALDCKAEGCKEATAQAPSVVDSLCRPCSEHFSGFKEALTLRGVPFKVNHRMVRGLDYYTRTTFEVTARVGGALGAQNAVAAGGRYDGLVEELGGPATPCFGFAIGMERLAMLVDKTLAGRPPLAYLIPVGEKARTKGALLARGLRELGVRVIVDYRGGALKGCMKRADRVSADFALILGDDEIEAGTVTVKNMKEGAQTSLDLKSPAVVAAHIGTGIEDPAAPEG